MIRGDTRRLYFKEGGWVGQKTLVGRLVNSSGHQGGTELGTEKREGRREGSVWAVKERTLGQSAPRRSKPFNFVYLGI